ncbi:AhpC/TSA family protein [Polaribacter sp. MSW13]|uniref:AhpC/TSA family protein n=1 Tax=Polaribacter marinus TaxID=2916838 RepID=A0A9X1VUV7_9FLAO|nr:TlpA disulfide reductase family protein [Polaribacter marinus]MCI2229981.1 AhpC/TSA family protein [Polaribacter marinus]
MKKIFVLIFLISSITQAQYNIKGTITPDLKSDWVILYKIEGAKQIFIKNTKIEVDSILIDDKKQAIGNFNFTLPNDAAPGVYRATYRLEEHGYIDFIFDKEDITFVFNPDYPDQSVLFSKSSENIFYKQYLSEISKAQQTLDSLQITALRNPSLDLKKDYKTALQQVENIQQGYLTASKNMYVQPFIKATLRANPKEIKTSPNEYMSNMVATFFDNMDFSNKTLINSSFLVDRITDYIFYINYSDNKETQQKLFKNSIKTVLSKITDLSFKKDVIEFLVTQFEESKNLELIGDLFENYYKRLPENIQNKKFINEKLSLFATEIGSIAPDFSWKENNKNYSLSKLNDAENYVLVFWSTDCSHCLREIPELHKFMQKSTKTKVIAFAMERNNSTWNEMKKTLPNWHHILGLNKWENKTARVYNINATPTYFVLDNTKKIIAKPDNISDVKAFLENK